MSEIKKPKSRKPITCKVILVGDSGVGKTSIMNRYLDKYSPDIPATLNTSFYTKFETINKHKINFQIWDTVGQEQYRSLNTLFFKDSHICIIVYDITRPESFENIKNYWYESVITNGLEGIICAIAGNKDDLSKYEKVDRNEVKQFCEEVNAILRFTSAKNNCFVGELFKELGEKFACSHFMKDFIQNSNDKDKNDENFNLDEKEKIDKKDKNKNRCC